MSYDVAVIGAGPAGAWCASRLAESGARVALIDGSHPREKPCGGGVTGRALALVGQPQLAGNGVPIESATFSFGGRTVAVSLTGNGHPVRLGVFDRRSFDAALVERAREAGAEVLPRRAVDVTRERGGWRIPLRETNGASERELTARWIVGADGPGSLVRKRVSRPFDKADLSIACGHFVYGATATRIDVVFEDSPAGYLWSFPRRDHLAVGICAQADVASVSTLMPIVDRWIMENVSGGTLRRYSWPIPSLTQKAIERERPGGDGWMLIGDAAGLVDPITREGIFFALESGAAAAESIAAGEDPSERYNSRLRDTIYRELAIAARIKARFYRPVFMSLLINALHRSEKIRTIMSDLVAGEQPYDTLRSRLIKTLEFRLMAELFIR